MRCVRCDGCLHTERDPFSDDWETWCLNCSGRVYATLPDTVQLPLKNFGNCPTCGRESLRNSGYCDRCFGSRVSAGMKKMKYGVAL